MPKTITGNDAEFRLTTEVPHDTEDIDAIDVERPVQDLLNNAAFLYRRLNELHVLTEQQVQQQPGYRLQSGVTALQIEPAGTQVFANAVHVIRYGGFTGAVTVTAQNLPGGVTATITPNPLPNGTDSATLTLTASAQAVPGAYDLILHTDGSAEDVRIPTIVLAQTLAPSFNLSGPASVAVDRSAGTSVTVALDLNRVGGFNSTITFDAAQLPAGVTVGFAPATVGGNLAQQAAATVATLTVGSGTPANRYTVVLRASGGGIVRTVSLTLDVSQSVQVGGTPDFSLSLSYDSGEANLINGATLTIARSGGFTGPVTLSAAQLPITGYYTEFDISDVSGRRVGGGWITAPAPYVLVNAQLSAVTIYGNTARITADGASSGWQGSGVAPRQSNGLAWGSTTLTATNDAGISRYASVDVRQGSRNL